VGRHAEDRRRGPGRAGWEHDKGGPAIGYKTVVLEWNWNGWWGRDANGREVKKGGVETPAWRKGLGRPASSTRSCGGATWWTSPPSRCSWARPGPSRRSWWTPMASTLRAFRPAALVTALYSRHHGGQLMEMKSEGVPSYAQRLRLEGIRPAPKVAMIDRPCDRRRQRRLLARDQPELRPRARCHGGPLGPRPAGGPRRGSTCWKAASTTRQPTRPASQSRGSAKKRRRQGA